MVLEKVRLQVKNVKVYLEQKIFYVYLRTKAKVRRLFNSKVVQFLLNADLTFVFLFFALKLFGYDWSFANLLASFGAWIVIKELLRHSSIALRKSLSGSKR